MKRGGVQFLGFWRKRRHAGFTLIELAVTVALIAILASVLLSRVMFYRDQAERVAMQQMIGSLRSGLHLQLAMLMVRHREHEIAKLAQQNPIQWLAEAPANYLGELDQVNEESLEKGHWYFNKRDRQLIYLIAGETGQNESNRVYLTVKLLRSKPTMTSSGQMLDGKVEGVIIEQNGP